MAFHLASSRQRYQKYKRDLKSTGYGKSGDASIPGGDRVSSHRSTTRSRSFGRLLSEFLGLLRGHRITIITCLATLTLSTLLNLIPPIGTKIVVDYVLGDHPLPDSLPFGITLPAEKSTLLGYTALFILFVASASIAIGIYGRWQATRTTKRVQVAVRKRVFDHAVRLPLHRIYALKSGGVASILREDAGGVGELIFSMLYNPWRAIIQLIGSLLILATVDWRLLVGCLAALPAIWITHRTWINRIRPLYRDIRATRQGVDSHATEAFAGMRVVRTFSRQRSEAARFTRNNHLMARQELNVWWWSRAVDIAWSLLIPAASAALLWYGGSRVLDGTLTIGDLLMFLAYLVMLLGPLATLAESATSFQNSLAGLDRILDLLAEPAEMPASEDSIRVDPATTRGSIAIENVTFAYPNAEQPVLHNINLSVRAGQMIALVGPSGSGKTTLCNLIARFYDPTVGTIRLDGRDLRDIDVDSYRRLLGIVEQDVFLFDGSIAENIGYARRDASMEQIIHVARLANAHDFITKLEKGYDTLIGERGVRLSGGQRQRIAIARALLADPRILILDEATSNLDTESERLIQASLATLLKGRTSFAIAHRLSTIAHADHIVVIENGRIIEQGSHDELMARSGRYHEMVILQTNPPAIPAQPLAAAPAELRSN